MLRIIKIKKICCQLFFLNKEARAWVGVFLIGSGQKDRIRNTAARMGEQSAVPMMEMSQVFWNSL